MFAEVGHSSEHKRRRNGQARLGAELVVRRNTNNYGV
jgi:hypothetical protein